MLQTATVEKGTYELLKQLMKDDFLSNFLLAGGTNLSLQIGHRQSVDLDLFSYKSFDAKAVEKYLHKKYRFVSLRVMERDTVIGYITDVKVDIVAHIYPLLNPPFIEDEIRFYSLQDIVCMKLVAISDNGTRLKDFVDIAFLSTKMSLTEMLICYQKKYNRPNYYHAVKGLSYFDDIEFNDSVNLINSVFSWKKIEKRICEMIKYENRIFETAPC
jgi:predicted nucleotidyltransferase component of viral defense system